MSVRLVLDASAAVHTVMATPRAPELIQKLENSQLVIAPSIFQAEVANALWKYARLASLSVEGALERLDDALDLVHAFEPDAVLVTEALAAAVRQGHPVYDFLYLVLARRYGCRLLTLDRKLQELAVAVDPELLA